MTADVERLGSEKYVRVTTFRRDGTPVGTPVWVGRDGDDLVVWTVTNAGKVKRIRNSGAVEVAACDIRGNVRGEPVRGTARILDAENTERVRRVLRKKYGVLGWLTVNGSIVRRGKKGTVGIAIRLGAARPERPEGKTGPERVS
jgi:PPOX class probable F420-dependent enzyme